MAFSPETYALLKGQGGGGGGSDLPSVTAADNGKVLSVVNGAWAADSMIVNVVLDLDTNTLNRTWQEIYNATVSGKIVILCRDVISDPGVEEHHFRNILEAIEFYSMDDEYVVSFVQAGTYLVFVTDSPNSYPVIQP